MEETKLIKLLDLALERIEALESDENLEIIERENEGFRHTIEELERDRSELQNYFDKANAEACELLAKTEVLKNAFEKANAEAREAFEENELLKTSIEEKDAAIFELQQNLEKLSKQRNELVLETANAGEVAQIKKENENLKTTNADLLKRLEEAAEANDRLAYDLSNSEVFIELRNENEKLSNKIRMLKTDKGILEDKLEELAKKSGESSPAKWNDILDPTKRPRPNEPVLITTKSGKIIIGSFEVDGSIRSSGKPTKATAWMKLPKPFTK